MLCWCGREEEDENEKRWEVLRKMISNSRGKC